MVIYPQQLYRVCGQKHDRLFVIAKINIDERLVLVFYLNDPSVHMWVDVDDLIPASI